MAPNPRLQDERLQALYDQIPHIDCQGLCSDSCGPISLSVRERTRIERLAGRPLSCGAGATCSMLTPERRCGVYAARPMICRLWGVARGLPCPYGCRPERVLEEDEAMKLLAAADAVGGAPTDRARDLFEKLRAAVAELDAEAFRRKAREARVLTTPMPTLDGRNVPLTVIERQR